MNSHNKLFRAFKLWLLFLAFAVRAESQTLGQMTPIEQITLTSKILNEERQIKLYQPDSVPGFPASVAPVIYVLDGEVVTELVRAHVGYFTEIWKELPAITVVGIQNKKDLSNRTRDLTPSRSRLNTGGGAEDFMRFIKEEIIPIVEKDYKTRPYRILIGASLGGLFTIHSFLNHSSTFDAFVASSPTLAWNDSHIMKDLPEKLKSATETK